MVQTLVVPLACMLPLRFSMHARVGFTRRSFSEGVAFGTRQSIPLATSGSNNASIPHARS